MPLWIIVFALMFAAVYAVRGPLAWRAASTQRAVTRAQAAERDTLPLIDRLQTAQARLNRDDSALQVLFAAMEAHRAARILSVALQHERDSLQAVVGQLDGALDRASKAPLSASYRALATTPALSAVGSAQMLVDTLDLLEETRRALDPVAAPQREFALISERANAIGRTLQEIGQSRRAALIQQIAAIDSQATATQGPARVTADTADFRMRRDGARLEVSRADSSLRDARQWHAGVQARADSAVHTRLTGLLGTSPFAAVLSASVVIAVLAFTLAVLFEVRAPRIAHAREVERLTGIPVLASSDQFRTATEGRARLQPGIGVDPFRMVYLALTANGTHEREVCVTGDSAPTAIVVAGRLAVCAAADERATLIVDLSPGMSGASAYFGWRDEPGFTEAIAGVRLWREVARPVGASEGMALDVVPAGVPRQDTDTSVQSATARDEFTRFISEYDFAVFVATTASSVRLAETILNHPPMILVARTARTRIRDLQERIQALTESEVRIHGIVLIS